MRPTPSIPAWPRARSSSPCAVGRAVGRRATAPSGRERRGVPRRTRACAIAILDLRREKLHANIVLRSRVISSIRRRMIEAGFTEFQTPIFTSSSPGGRARLPRAEPSASGQVLRAAAGATAVQAAPDGRGVRPVLPDRALFPGRGWPGRPIAGRVLPARLRDVVRDAGGCLAGHRAGAARRVRGIRGRPGRHAAAVSAHSLRRGDGAVRNGQARPAQPDRDRGCRARCSPARASGCSPMRPPEARWCGPFPGPGRRPAEELFRSAGGDGRRSRALQGSAGWPSAKERRAARSRSSSTRTGSRGSREVTGEARATASSSCAIAATVADPLAGKLRTKLGEDLDLVEKNAFRFCWITDFPMYELGRGHEEDRVQPQSVLDAAG